MEKPLSRQKVLIVDGDARQSLPMMRALKQKRHHVALACPSRTSMGYLSRYPDRRLLWPDYMTDPDGFTAMMMDYLRQHRPNVTLAVCDTCAGILSRNKAEITRYTNVTVPDYDIFVRSADKAQTMAFCMENDIPCPQTFFPEREDIESIIERAPFPVMVKPRCGIGAMGLHRLESKDDLRRHYQTLRERYGELIIQEFIPLEGGTQYQAEAFLDADSRLKVCMVIAKPRFFPITGGTSTANVTIDRPDIAENVRRLLEGIRWSGPADVDLMLDPRDNVPKILEINPRVTAGIKIGFTAGIDYADYHVRLAMGEPMETVERYKLGVHLRNLCLDILWYYFASKEMRRSTWPPFFHFFGKDVHYQTFGLYDPLPLAGFILGNIRKYGDPKVWKAKLAKDLEE